MGEGPAPEVKNPGPIVRIVLIHADGSEEVLPPKGQRIVDFTANCAVVAARGGNSQSVTVGFPSSRLPGSHTQRMSSFANQTHPLSA
jgi:hypothetical protein